jgi:hypothetical protein
MTLNLRARTSSAAIGASEGLVQRHLRHAKRETTARYIRAGRLFHESPTALAGF